MISFFIIIFLIFLVIYFIYQNRYTLKINKLLKNRQLKSIIDKPELLDKPLNEFYINSSHNSYLNSIQHVSISNHNMLKNILQLGARCIEIDISYINNIPIVAHGTAKFITTSFIYLDKILDTIIKYGFNTSDPLIIFCEIFNPENKIFNENIKKLFINKFKDKLLLPNNLPYSSEISKSKLISINNKNNFIANKPIKLFLNKVILFGTIDNYDILRDILFPTDNFLNWEDTDPRVKNIYTGDQLSKIYKTEGLYSFLSFNINFIDFWKNNYKLIGMNYQMKDKLLYEYLKYFKSYSFIHQSEILF